jgi:NADH dehydrogenase [ubiquinone] 1 alpha subcomplex assembly factor 1
MVLLLLTATLHVTLPSAQPDSVIVVDFARAPGEWFVVNDGVMGGVSSSTIVVTADGIGVFAGRLSLENNGGFASVRTDVSGVDLSGTAGLVLRVRGDGRAYQVRLRTDERFDGIAYSATFPTEPGRWQTVVLPFDAFVPTFRGSTPRNAPPLDPGAVRQLGLLIGDKREGPFRLEVERITAVRDLGPARRPSEARQER